MAMEGLTLARGNRGLLLIALLAGLIAAVLVFAALAQGNDGSGTTSGGTGATVTTVVATQDIEAGTEIKAEMVRIVEWPENLRVAGALSDSALPVGEVANVAISQGEALTPEKIGPAVDDKGLGPIVPPGMRAMGLEVEEVTAVGGNLLPGDRVDVVAVFEDGLTTLVLQDLEVLAVAQEAQEALAANESGNDAVTSGHISNDVKEQPSAVTLTLALLPNEALKLALVQEQAVKVYTILRPFGDGDPVGTEPVNLGAVRP
jgi:Flp pilus assembly protein CpaB